jgi:GxxExxY protein
MDIEQIFKKVLDCSFKVHTALGPGLLESAYVECLYYELILAGKLQCTTSKKWYKTSYNLIL